MTAKPIYRMSSAGKCPRALSAKRLGYEPVPAKPWLEQAANEGKWHELRIIDELMSSGYGVFDRQLEVKIEYPEFVLLGHIDGKVVSNGNIRLLEIKSMGQFEFDRWMRWKFDAFPEYAVQLACYLAATKLNESLYIVKNRNTGYTARMDILGTVADLEEVVAKLTKVEHYVLHGSLAPAEFDPQLIQCQRCNYQHLCVTKPEPSDIDIIELDKAVGQWRRGKQMVDEGRILMENADLTLGSYASRLDTKRFIHNELVVQLVHTKRESYSRKKLLEIFTAEQLAPALEVREYDQLRHYDTRKGNEDGDDSN